MYSRPHFEGTGSRRGQQSYHCLFSIQALHCDHCAISISNVCDAQFNTGGSVWVKILGCYLWSRSVMLGSARSKRPRRTNDDIIFEDFQHTSTLRTDLQTTCRNNTTLCIASRGKNKKPNQAVARIANRTASQHLRGSRDVIGYVTIR